MLNLKFRINKLSKKGNEHIGIEKIEILIWEK